jgi:hypothetical protein
MARVTPEQIRQVTRLAGSVKEAATRRKEDTEQRARAVNLINPHEVRGEYDVERLLFTTLHGDLRPITHNDLAAFRQNAKTVGSRLKKGLKAQQVINLSRQEDRDRANKQIHMAVPAGSSKGVIRFVTNAGPDSQESRHHVAVELTNYEAAIASPAEPKKMALWLVKEGPLKFECDCKHHRYVYRYIATIGGYNLGRSEPAFPKIRNPTLSGVACKHVLRVMHELLHNAAIRTIVAKMVERGQSSHPRNATTVSKENAEKIAQMQAKRKREIEAKASPKETAKLKTMIAVKKPAVRQRDGQQALKSAQAGLKKLRLTGQLSEADFEVIMRKLTQ